MILRFVIATEHYRGNELIGKKMFFFEPVKNLNNFFIQ